MAFTALKKNINQLDENQLNGELWVTSRLKTDLLITLTDPVTQQKIPLYILKSIPTNLLEQTNLTNLKKNGDFTKHINSELLILIESESVEQRHKDASRSRLRELGRSNLAKHGDELMVSKEEALGGTNTSGNYTEARVSDYVKNSVRRIGVSFDDAIDAAEKELSKESAINLLIELEIDATEHDKRYIRDNLAAHIIQKHAPGLLDSSGGRALDRQPS